MSVNINDTEILKYIQAVKNYNGTSDRRVYILTFGCQQNEADSEKLLGLSRDMGYTRTDTPDKADLILVNTCAIRDHAERKALSLIGGFKALKRKNPELIIGVLGCMAAEEHNVELLKKDFHYVSFTLLPSLLHKFPEMLYTALIENKRKFIFDSGSTDIIEGIEEERTSTYRAWVSVMYGCNNFCSYCIVPYVRGRERSRDSADILAECRSLAARGYKEITLLGQNVNSYSSDMDFPTLLSKVAEIDGDFVIKFMTSHPKDVSDSLIEVMSKYTPKIAPVFHLPLQSGSDRILAAMNRTYDRERFLSIVDKLRAAVPDITLTSDVIVGFPGEGEEDFLSTLEVLNKVRFDSVYSFVYSERVGTRAVNFDGKVPEKIKTERITKLLDMQGEISYGRNERHIGKIERVLAYAPTKRGEAGVFDGRTLSGKLVHFKSDESCIGKFVNVKIERVGAFDLFGTVCDI